MGISYPGLKKPGMIFASGDFFLEVKWPKKNILHLNTYEIILENYTFYIQSFP